MVLCVTGPMAAGKNAATSILAERGFATIDADVVAHGVIDLVAAQIIAEFSDVAEQKGVRIQNDDGTVNRRALGALIFGNAELVARQEAIVFPKINELIEEFITLNAGGDVAVNATVLHKVAAMRLVDAILYVDAPALVRLARAVRRDSNSARNVLARFAAQKNLFAKYRSCGADIKRVWNTGTRHRLEKKIDEFLATCR